MTDSEIKFHLDESVNNAIKDGLKRNQIDVTTTNEANLVNASDEEQLAFALSTNRIIFTHDDDFLRFNSQEIEHSGIVYCHQNDYSIGNILKWLIYIYNSETPASMINRIQFVKKV